jgi:hypothetical protein
VHISKGFIMKKITKALLVVSLTAAANVALAADNSYYPSDGTGLAGFPAIEGGTARSYAHEHRNDRVLQGEGIYPSNGHSLAGFDPIPGGTARSFADAHPNGRVLAGDAAFPSEDAELAGVGPVPGGAARSYADAHYGNSAVAHAAPTFPAADSEVTGD